MHSFWKVTAHSTLRRITTISVHKRRNNSITKCILDIRLKHFKRYILSTSMKNNINLWQTWSGNKITHSKKTNKQISIGVNEPRFLVVRNCFVEFHANVYWAVGSIVCTNFLPIYCFVICIIFLVFKHKPVQPDALGFFVNKTIVVYCVCVIYNLLVKIHSF